MIVAGVAATHAATIRVPRDYATIQLAIDGAREGDDIEVDAGTYYERLDFKGKAIRVTGAGSASTTVDASRVGSVVSGGVVYFRSGETSHTVLSGFTITGGRTTKHGGGHLLFGRIRRHRIQSHHPRLRDSEQSQHRRKRHW